MPLLDHWLLHILEAHMPTKTLFFSLPSRLWYDGHIAFFLNQRHGGRRSPTFDRSFVCNNTFAFIFTHCSTFLRR